MFETVLRFAPSPTGGFHVGNARTALFNFLYAKHYGAKLLLRVEDTDRKRFNEASLQTILDGLTWLGIEFDEEPVYQSRNLDRHRQAVEKLLESGHAYYAYETPEELKNMHRQAKSGKLRVEYNRDLSLGKQADLEEQGRMKTVRFKVPKGETVWEDSVRGKQRWDNKEVEDFLLLRADGTPVYQLAVVVDDHHMGVTLVMRGADHLSNTPKQIMLFKALEWDVPTYSHNSLTLGADGKKLSKRHGATKVTEYQEQGYLSDTVFNFLALLGWTSGDGREVFSRRELIEVFSIEGMLTRDAIFDEKKLEWLNSEHLRRKSLDSLFQEAVAVWVEAGWISEFEVESRKKELTKIVGLLRERIRTVRDFLAVGYFFKDPDQFEEKARKRHWKGNTLNRMETLISRLEVLEVFNEEGVEGATRILAGELEISPARLIHPARLALSGVGFGPGLFELMQVLGRETCIRRLRTGVKLLGGEAPVSKA